MNHWLESSVASPEILMEATVVVDKHIYSFGGWLAERSMDGLIEVHCFDTVEMEWTNVSQRGDIPDQREGHSVVVYNGYVYLWGGVTSSPNPTHFRKHKELFRYDPRSRNWSQISFRGCIPTVCDKTTAFVYNDRMYIFGETQPGACNFSTELSYLDFNTMEWTHVEPTELTSPLTTTRSVFLFDGKMYVLQKQKVDCLDLETNLWESPPVLGVSTKNLPKETPFVYENEAYLFVPPKDVESSVPRTGFSQAFRFDPVRCAWELTELYGKIPPPRWYPSYNVVGDQLFMFSGSTTFSSDTIGDTRVLKLNDKDVDKLELMAEKYIDQPLPLPEFPY